jgi:hypothetical protein
LRTLALGEIAQFALESEQKPKSGRKRQTTLGAK